MNYVWVAIGSALGGIARYGLTRAMVTVSAQFPWGTVCVNVLGCFVIGFFGTLTLAGSRYAMPESCRLFVMVGVCGGFTTFSSFSLQTFDLLRAGEWERALLNVGLSVALCLAAVAAGHAVAQKASTKIAITQTQDEELSG